MTRNHLVTYNVDMDLVFKALADPVRRKLLDELTEKNGQSLYELCTRIIVKHQMAISRQAIMKHLAILERAGLVRTEKQGRYKLHYIQTEPIAGMYDRWIIKHHN